jgi:hypothetical protein
MNTTNNNNLSGKRAGWIALLTAATVLFSLAFACATPFAALACVAALKLQRRDAFLLVGASWLVNQLVGYGVLNYPQTWDSFAWGAVIGLGAMAATAAAFEIDARVRKSGAMQAAVISALASFAIAFVAYQAVLFAATAFLPSGEAAFSARVVLDILKINIAAFAGLLVLQRIGEATGIAAPRATHA